LNNVYQIQINIVAQVSTYFNLVNISKHYLYNYQYYQLHDDHNDNGLIKSIIK